MKKRLLVPVVLLLLFCFSSCGHEHEWMPATCTAPETCAECGKTRGEARGHFWLPAACARPETCSRCGETRGEAPGHTPVGEATYQDAPVCSVCGEPVGEPLEASFPAHGLAENMEVGVPAAYNTLCSDEVHETTAIAVVTDYRVFGSDQTHEAKDGYEWRCVTMEVTFSDDNARKYGRRVNWVCEDWYTVELHDDTLESRDGGSVYSVSWHGSPAEAFQRIDLTWGSWVNNTRTATILFEFCVPVGYDGAVVGLRNPSVKWKDGMYIYDLADANTLFFRLK